MANIWAREKYRQGRQVERINKKRKSRLKKRRGRSKKGDGKEDARAQSHNHIASHTANQPWSKKKRKINRIRKLKSLETKCS